MHDYIFTYFFVFFSFIKANTNAKIFLFVFYLLFFIIILTTTPEDNKFILNTFTIASFSLFTGILLSKRKKRKVTNEKKYKHIFIIIPIIASLTFLLIYAKHGIPILKPQIRSNISSYFTYIIALSWISTPYYLIFLKKKAALICVLTSTFIAFCMAYRTPIAYIAITFFLANQSQKIITKKNLYITFITLFSLIMLMAGLRKNTEIEKQYQRVLNEQNIEKKYIIAAPILSLAYEGNVVLNGIKKHIHSSGYNYGLFTLSGMTTILPGKQIHPRAKLSRWLGRKNWRESTTTPTLMGQAYIEFGKLGIILFFFFSGYYLNKNNFTSKNSRALHISLSGILILSIHTGILDPLFFLFLMVYFFSKLTIHKQK